MEGVQELQEFPQSWIDKSQRLSDNYAGSPKSVCEGLGSPRSFTRMNARLPSWRIFAAKAKFDSKKDQFLKIKKGNERNTRI